MLKSYRAWFLWKIHFLSNLGKNGPKIIGYFPFFKKCGYLIFLKAMQIESSFNSWISIANPMSGKILVLELSTKMFLTNQTAGLKCSICRKIKGIELIFCLWINIRISFKVVLSLMVDVARHIQSTKNKFAISLYYFKKEMRDKYDL